MCAFERFIRSFGIVQTAFSKSTSSHIASCSSLLRTMVCRIEAHAEPDGRQRRHLLEQLEHDPDLGRRERPILRHERRDRSWPDIVSRIGHLLAVQDREAIDLLEDVADVDRRRRRAALDDGATMRPQVVWRDFGQQPVAPLGQQFALEDRSAHRPRAVRHRRRGQPLLAELAKALRFQEPALLPLLFDRRRASLADRPLGVDAQLAGTSERQPGRAVLAERDGLAPSIHPVIQPKREGPRWLHEDIHAVPVRHLVNFLFWFQMLKGCIRQHFGAPPKRPSGHFGRFVTPKSLYYQRLTSEKVPSRSSVLVTGLSETAVINMSKHRQS